MENTVWYYSFVAWWGVSLAVKVAGVGSLGFFPASKCLFGCVGSYL
jgi:hypothetical protein